MLLAIRRKSASFLFFTASFAAILCRLGRSDTRASSHSRYPSLPASRLAAKYLQTEKHIFNAVFASNSSEDFEFIFLFYFK